MSTTTPGDEKREELRRKIEEGEKRHADRSIGEYAQEAAETATEFVKKHPVATVAGAVTIGLMIGAMTRPGRRVVKRGGTLATLASEAVLAYGMSMIDKAGELAEAGEDKLADFGDAVGDKARQVRRDAEYMAGNTADRGRIMKRKAGRGAERAVRSLKGRISH